MMDKRLSKAWRALATPLDCSDRGVIQKIVGRNLCPVVSFFRPEIVLGLRIAREPIRRATKNDIEGREP
jgi:hypothetical protein